jgi:homoisocitrate dehydrogenase
VRKERMKVCIIPGDGIGPEVIHAALQVLRALVPGVELVEAEAGWATFQATGAALPPATLAAASESDAVLFGAVASPSHAVPGYRSPIVALRRELGLYANIRPTTDFGLPIVDFRLEAEAIQNLNSKIQNRVNLVVVRENTEDLYVGRERLEDDGETAIAERVITRRASERIVRAAFELAIARVAQTGDRGRETGSRAVPGSGLPSSVSRPPKVTVVHKANVLRVTDGLFRETALAVAREFPKVQVEELLVDTAAMHLARSPERFDVIVTTNMFGDILSDIACIHGGGLGLASSANIGETQALFEPVHGAAPDIVGKGIANPLAAIGCVAMLLEWYDRRPATGDRSQDSTIRSSQFAVRSSQLQSAIQAVVRHGPHTPDMGGTATTEEVTDAILRQLK